MVLFIITLKLGVDNHSHHFQTYHVNVPINIRVLVLLSQFVPYVIKYKVIVCDHLLSIVLISFRQSISRYTFVFPNCSIFVSFGLYFGILYCFPYVSRYSSFILLILLYVLQDSYSLFHLDSFSVFLSLCLLFQVHLSSSFIFIPSIVSFSITCIHSFIFLFLSNSKYCSNNFSSTLPFSISSFFIVLSKYFLNIICYTISLVVPLMYFRYFPILIRVFCYISIFIILWSNLFTLSSIFLIYYPFFLSLLIFLPIMFIFF